MNEAAKRKNRTGWYYRIIDPGLVTAGGAAVLLKRPNRSWSITRFSQYWVSPTQLGRAWRS